MLLIPFSIQSMWGVKIGNTELLPPFYSELFVFQFRNKELTTVIHNDYFTIKDGKEKNSVLSKIEGRNRHQVAKHVGEEMGASVDCQPGDIVLFLVKHKNETFLFKIGRSLKDFNVGLFNLYTEFKTFTHFTLDHNLHYSDVNKDGVMELGRYHSDIQHIGFGFFKIKVIDVSKNYLGSNDEGEDAWKMDYTYSWRVIDFNGRPVSKCLFSEVIDFFNGESILKKPFKIQVLTKNGLLK